MKKFPCTSCGVCCKSIEKIMETNPYAKQLGHPLYFPHKWDENGVCEKLENNLCSVYEDRPLVCNVDGLIDKYDLNREVIHKLNASICNREIKKAGIDQKYLVKI